MIRTAAHSSFNRLVFLLLLGVFWSVFHAAPACAARPSTLLSKAEREFTSLKKNRALQLKRHNYEKVESRYSRVFSGYPGTKEAAKALLRCGELYTLLYRWNSRKADLDRSRDYYQRLLRDYPRSSQADNAQFEIANLYLLYYDDPARAYREFEQVLKISPKGDMATDARAWTRKLRRYRAEPAAAPAAAPAPGKSSSTASTLLKRADSDFAALRKDSSRQRFRHHYLNVLDRYRRVFEKHPGTVQAETALLRAGELYTLLFRWTALKPDLNSAKHYYQRLVKDYP